jgi:exonuclease VII large subunit
MQMTAVEAKTPALAAPSPGNATPPKAAPPEPELMRALAPSQAAEIAVEAFRELQEELQILEHADPTSPWIGVKEREAKLAQDWAIKLATKNCDLVAAEDKPADDLRKKLRSEVDKLSHGLSWNENGPEMRRLRVLEQNAVRAESAYTAVHVRLLDAESLLQQANSSSRQI